MSNKLISQLTPAGSNLQDIDLAEGQKSGEVFTRKFTGAQMRAVEKAAREAQDDVIEGGCGLQTDGTYLPESRTWGLRAGDFAAGCIDRVGATGVLTPNLQNGLRLLDAKVGTGNIVILHAGLTADSTLLLPAVTIPPRYLLTYIVFEEKNGGTPVLDLGTTLNGNEVFLQQTMTASDLTTIVVERPFSLGVSTDLYLTDASGTWDAALLDAYFVLTPLIPGGTSGTGIIVVTYYSGAYGLSSPPTEAEITAIIGNPTNFGASSIFTVNDTLGHVYQIMSDNVHWYYSTAYTELV
jgi:hypothetical protein